MRSGLSVCYDHHQSRLPVIELDERINQHVRGSLWYRPLRRVRPGLSQEASRVVVSAAMTKYRAIQYCRAPRLRYS